jgi:hypothetical protein
MLAGMLLRATDLLHVGHIFGHVIAIVLSRVVHPFGVVLIELALIVRGKPALIRTRRIRAPPYW